MTDETFERIREFAGICCVFPGLKVDLIVDDLVLDDEPVFKRLHNIRVSRADFADLRRRVDRLEQ